MKPKWLAIAGKPQISQNEITFLPSKIDSSKIENGEDESLENYSLSKIRSNLYFSTGNIELSVLLKSNNDRIYITLDRTGDDDFINVCLNSHGYAYAISKYSNGSSEWLNTNGWNINPPINEWLRLKINQIGSNIEFYINDVIVAKTQVVIHNAPIEIFYRGQSKAIVKDISINNIRPKAFVIMQFSDIYDSLYQEVIAPVCQEHGFDVVRGDDMYTTGLIIEDITQVLQESSLIIADITPNNPNVYYEVGYAHGMQKDTILMSNKEREKLPFDISGFRLLFYEDSIAGKPRIESTLRKHLEAIKIHRMKQCWHWSNH